MNRISQPTNCRVCNGPASLVARPQNVTAFECARCGEYTLDFVGDIGTANNISLITKLSALIRQETNLGSTASLNAELIDRAEKIRAPLVTERLNMLLRYLLLSSKKYLDSVQALEPRVLAETWSDRNQAVIMLTKYLSENELISLTTDGKARLTPRGWIEAEKIGLHVFEGQQAFIAMWFADEMKSVSTDAIEPAIRDAGYLPRRIDKKEHANKIDDEIIAEIRKSKFLIADFTGHRGGVYFEAGFAMGLNIPVFFTCRKDALKELHFDIRQYNTIDWVDEAELRTRLRNRIIAVIGEGPKARN